MFEPQELDRAVAETGVTQAAAANESDVTTRRLGVLAILLVAALGFILFKFLLSGTDVPLRVDVQPAVAFELELDGALVGNETPVVIPDVSVGQHRLTVRADGYLSQEYTFEVVEGGENQVSVRLEPDESAFMNGTLVVITEPAQATVLIDDRDPLESPVTADGLDRRTEHVVVVSAEGYLPQTRRVQFRESERETLKISLERALRKAALEIISKPPGATVMLDGEPRGKTPLNLEDLPPTETSRLSLVLTGYEPYNEVLVLQPGKTSSLRATLKAVPTQRRGKGCVGDAGKWSVMTVNIPDCRVRIGKVEMGVAPFFNKKGPSGRCEVKVECLDGRKKTLRRKAQAGKNERIIIKQGDWN